jgi:GPH family glycoside/pentoside/hexuronide:cation symporter
MNGIWLGVMMSLFYISFTAYVNPYLALISDLNINDENRINLSTKIALFGLLGMVLITVIFPNIIISLQNGRMGFRASYQITIIGFSLISFALLISAALSFNEQKHSLTFTSQPLELFTSLKSVFSSKAFSAFIIGEMFLQFAMNIITMGMMYYGVVIFRQGQGFITILAGLIIAIALIFFPVVNISAKKLGKINVILIGVLVFNLSTLVFFSLSFVMTGIFYYLGLFVIALSGLPLAVLTILINPIIAEIAINHALVTGQHKGAMFFGARAIPLKAIIALAGAVFTFLLSAYGKDIAKPLGVQLSILVASLSSFGALFFFCRYKRIVENYSVKNYKNINRVEYL